MNKQNSKTTTVNCPTCSKTVEWTGANEYRPFCSKRCKLIDFGEWATEKHSIAGDPVFLEDEELDGPIQ
jgi:endogenous inhibitor of DNA gyrase (YacG/DUF329 family)